MAGTVKMGKPGDPNTCVDHDLRVLGVNSLRVADMSILPILPKYVSMSLYLSRDRNFDSSFQKTPQLT
jgi:choline dehydrogenase-like flavoprotein